MGSDLCVRTGRAVFVSAGSSGMGYVGPGQRGHVPAMPVKGPVDTVGAGDAASAGIVGALACGATLAEAAAFASLVAAATVTKIGVTGTASPREVEGLLP